MISVVPTHDERWAIVSNGQVWAFFSDQLEAELSLLAYELYERVDDEKEVRTARYSWDDTFPTWQTVPQETTRPLD